MSSSEDLANEFVSESDNMSDTLDRITKLEKNVDFLNKNVFLKPDPLVSSQRLQEKRDKLEGLKFNRSLRKSEFGPKRITDADKRLLVLSGIPRQELGGKRRRTRRLSSQKRRRFLRRTRTKR